MDCGTVLALIDKACRARQSGDEAALAQFGAEGTTYELAARRACSPSFP
jgi:hypothetical protein